MINIDDYDAIYLFSWLNEIANSNTRDSRIHIENYMWSDIIDEDFLREFIGYDFQLIKLGEHKSYTTEVDYEVRLWNPRGEETILKTSMSYRDGWNSIENVRIK